MSKKKCGMSGVCSRGASWKRGIGEREGMRAPYILAHPQWDCCGTTRECEKPVAIGGCRTVVITNMNARLPDNVQYF